MYDNTEIFIIPLTVLKDSFLTNDGGRIKRKRNVLFECQCLRKNNSFYNWEFKVTLFYIFETHAVTKKNLRVLVFKIILFNERIFTFFLFINTVLIIFVIFKSLFFIFVANYYQIYLMKIKMFEHYTNDLTKFWLNQSKLTLFNIKISASY